VIQAQVEQPVKLDLSFIDKKEKLVDTSVSLVTKLVSEQET
jgi:hypothetical protein